MTGHGAKFARKMEAAIAALVSRPSIEDAARTAGVAEKTLRRWMREPQFNAEYLRAAGRGLSGSRTHAAGHGRRRLNHAEADDRSERASGSAAEGR